uniref:Uncharacterized protein n=1 Tax=Candidatus Kentrum sp. DK TaxID=2126562 RepID=A0A450SWY9_9GAMM|nr:MAG: hypothetical protein BECKDK2373C_GA0170839_10665 [Candidatus Kentron sp. DK]VFJ60568.1 MAG: hypothetical protein BECKDK2373B_GA0170837_109318 [Candidatus Kentron sp. DK]
MRNEPQQAGIENIASPGSTLCWGSLHSPQPTWAGPREPEKKKAQGNANLPPLSSYADAIEAERCKQHLSYRRAYRRLFTATVSGGPSRQSCCFPGFQAPLGNLFSEAGASKNHVPKLESLGASVLLVEWIGREQELHAWVPTLTLGGRRNQRNHRDKVTCSTSNPIWMKYGGSARILA